MSKHPMWKWIVALSMLFCLAAFLPGQSVNAQIYGSVQNEEGEYLTGVKVVALNTSNNAATTVFIKSEDKGAFRLLGLAPGIYQVSCDLEGYQSYVASGIKLSADQSATLRIKLKPLEGPDGASARLSAKHAQTPDSRPDEGPWNKWQFELSGGTLNDAPADLNRFSSHDHWVCLSKAYSYVNTYGLFMIYKDRVPPQGALDLLGGSRPLTARFRYSLNRRFSLAMGIEYSDHKEVSEYSDSYAFCDQQWVSVNFISNTISDFRLGMRGTFPHVGAQMSFQLKRNLRVAGFVNTGWMFAECRYSSTRHSQDGFLGQDRTFELAMSGRGSSLVLEGGAKVEIALWRSWGFFIEGFYRLGRVKKVTGQRTGSETIQDGGTLETGSRSTEKREGRWVMIGDESFDCPNIASQGDATEYPSFTLDLGGMGARLGLFFRF